MLGEALVGGEEIELAVALERRGQRQDLLLVLDRSDG